MKKRYLSLLFLLLSVTFVSAAYKCSEDSEFISSSKEIDIGERKPINGINLVVSKADETPAVKRISADLIIEGRKVSLLREILNATASEQVEILDKNYNVTLLEITGTIAKIGIDGSSEKVEVGEYVSIKGLQVIPISAEASGPERISAEVIVGADKIILSNNELEKVITVKNVQYLISLESASDAGALVEVSKCGNGTMVEKPDEQPLQNVTEENSTEQNITDQQNNLTDENYTLSNQTEVNQTSAQLTNETQANQTEQKINEDKEKTGIIRRIINWFSRLFD